MRFLRWLFLVLIVAGAGVGGLYFLYDRTFYPEPPKATYPAPKTTAEARAQDLDYLRHVFELDRSWTPQTRAAAEAKLKQLEGRAAALDPLEFEFAVAEIVALADNGHTSAQAGERAKKYNRAPFRLYPFVEGFFVTRADGERSELLGAELIKIEGRPLSEVVQRTYDFASGLQRSRDVAASLILESPEQLHTLGFSAKAASTRYTFRLANGQEVEREIEGFPIGPRRVRATIDRWLSPEPIKEEPGDWRAWITPEHEPIALKDPDLPYRSVALPEFKALFIQFRENRDIDQFRIADFIAAVTKVIAQTKPENIVLDMRFNGGGDYTTTVDFMRALPKLVPSRVFVLTGPLTFSAGISSVAFLKAAGGPRVVIVGEPVGDRLVAYGEGGRMTLPNSGISIRFATGLHDYQHGCAWFGPCFWVNYLYSVSVPTLDPDLPAPMSGRAFAEGRDPALEAVGAALGTHEAASP